MENKQKCSARRELEHLRACPGVLVTVLGSAEASAFVFPPELWGLSPWTEGLGSLGEGACPACVCAACEV